MRVCGCSLILTTNSLIKCAASALFTMEDVFVLADVFLGSSLIKHRMCKTQQLTKKALAQYPSSQRAVDVLGGAHSSRWEDPNRVWAQGNRLSTSSPAQLSADQWVTENRSPSQPAGPADTPLSETLIVEKPSCSMHCRTLSELTARLTERRDSGVVVTPPAAQRRTRKACGQPGWYW